MDVFTDKDLSVPVCGVGVNVGDTFYGETIREIRDQIRKDHISGPNVDKTLVLFETLKKTYEVIDMSYGDFVASRRVPRPPTSIVDLDDWLEVMTDAGYIVILMVVHPHAALHDGEKLMYMVRSISTIGFLSSNGLIVTAEKVGVDYVIVIYYCVENKCEIFFNVNISRILEVFGDLSSLPVEWVYRNKEQVVEFEDMMKRVYGKQTRPVVFYRGDHNPIHRMYRHLMSINRFNAKLKPINCSSRQYNSVMDYTTREALLLVGSRGENMIDVMCPCAHPWGVAVYKEWIEHPVYDQDIISGRHRVISAISSDPVSMYAWKDKIDKLLDMCKPKLWTTLWQRHDFIDVASMRKFYVAFNSLSNFVHKLRSHSTYSKVREYDNICHSYEGAVWVAYPYDPNLKLDKVFVLRKYDFDYIDDKTDGAVETSRRRFLDRSGLVADVVTLSPHRRFFIVDNTDETRAQLDANGCAYECTVAGKIHVQDAELVTISEQYMKMIEKGLKLARLETFKLIGKLVNFRAQLKRLSKLLGTEECLIKVSESMMSRNTVLPEFTTGCKIDATDMSLPDPSSIPGKTSIARLRNCYPLFSVSNSFTMDSVSPTMIHGNTGSGKSSFMLILGINTVLALAGLPVYAKRYSLPVFHMVAVHSGINDALEHGVSSFEREIMRVNDIISDNENKVVLMLTDELHQCVRQDYGETLLTLMMEYLLSNCKRFICVMSTHHNFEQSNRSDYVFGDNHVMRRGCDVTYDLKSILTKFNITSSITTGPGDKRKR